MHVSLLTLWELKTKSFRTSDWESFIYSHSHKFMFLQIYCKSAFPLKIWSKSHKILFQILPWWSSELFHMNSWALSILALSLMTLLCSIVSLCFPSLILSDHVWSCLRHHMSQDRYCSRGLKYNITVTVLGSFREGTGNIGPGVEL